MRVNNLRQEARIFLKAFPLGSVLRPEKFDEHFRKRGLLNTPADIPKNSDSWLAHLQRRHQLRYNLNKEALRLKAAPELFDDPDVRDDHAFVIEAVAGNVWEVRAPHIAISKSKIGRRVVSLVKTKRKQLGVLMSSADWSVLPAHEQPFALALYDDIKFFEENIKFQSSHLSQKFQALRGRLDKAVAAGQIVPIDGGIKALSEPVVEHDDPDDEADEADVD